MSKHKLPPFENVAANSTAILPRIPMGETYDKITLKLGGTAFTKAMITAIRLRLGGKLIWDVTGTALDTINQYMGETASAAYLTLNFAERQARTIVGEEIGAIDTSLPYSGFSMEVDIGAATAPTLAGWADRSAPQTGKPHQALFRAITKAVETPGAAGVFNLDMPLGSDKGTLIKRIHMFHSNVTEFAVKKNGLDLQDQGEIALIQFEQNELARTTQAGHFAYDPIVRDNQSEAVSTVRGDGSRANFEFKATLSAADTITSYPELYSDINRV